MLDLDIDASFFLAIFSCFDFEIAFQCLMIHLLVACLGLLANFGNPRQSIWILGFFPAFDELSR